MPSPFPDMDPFLEDPRLWESFHSRFISVLDEMLSLRVRPHFYVEEQSSVYIVAPNGVGYPPIKPDVYLVAAGRVESAHPPAAAADRRITQPTVVTARFPDEIRQRYLEIRDAHSHAVVTVIEVLSPTNKERRSRGRRAFLRKRREVMASPVHWVEIDLLRAGERPAEAAGQSDYYALLKRGDRGAEFEIWFVNLRDSLPSIAIPLTAAFADVALDLRAAFDTTYDRYYGDRMDYVGEPPPPRLTPADAAWVAARLGAARAE